MDEGSTTAVDGTTLFTGEAWFDPIEAGIRERGRGFIEELVEPAPPRQPARQSCKPG